MRSLSAAIYLRKEKIDVIFTRFFQLCEENDITIEEFLEIKSQFDHRTYEQLHKLYSIERFKVASSEAGQ